MDIITLINTLVSGLLNAQEGFLEHLDQFADFIFRTFRPFCRF